MTDKTGMFRAQRSDGQGVVEGYYRHEQYAKRYDLDTLICGDRHLIQASDGTYNIDPNTLEYLGVEGCEWCKALSFNPDIGGCQLVFFKSKKHPKGEYAVSVSVFDEYGEEQEPVLVQIDNCIRCGKRLEVEP